MFFFTGSYTETGSPAANPAGAGITCCSFNPDTGSVQISSQYFQRNPSYPVVSPDGKYLYVAEEMYQTGNPLLLAFRILEDGSLGKLNEVPLPADFACHLAVVNQSLLVANYMSSDWMVFGLHDDGSIGAMHQHIVHQGSGANAKRQEAPHPHMICPLNDRTIFCVDLGIDTAKCYQLNSDSNQWEPHTAWDIRVNPGAGARHMDINRSNGMVAVLGELTGDLFLYKSNEGGFELVDTRSLGEPPMSGGAIRFHPGGRWLYCSERKTNSIYAFELNSDGLQPAGIFASHGATPRDIAIAPSGNWLIAANQDDDNIAVFAIETQTGALQFHYTFGLATPSCICWQPYSQS